MSIVQKIVLWFLGLILIPTVLVGSLLFISFRDKITDAVVGQLKYTATVQQNRIEAAVQNNKDLLDSYTNRVLLSAALYNYLETRSPTDLQLLNETLASARDAAGRVTTISILDFNGTVIASSDTREIGGNLAESYNFSVAKQENTVFNPYINPAGKLSINLSGPIRFKDKAIAVAYIETNAKDLESIMSDYLGLGETGETILVRREIDGDATFIANTRFDPTAALQRGISADQTDSPIIQAANGIAIDKLDDVSYRDKPVISIARPIKGTDWGMVVQIEQREAYKPLADLLDTLAILMFVIVVLGVFIALYSARAITGPLVILTLAVKRMGEGDLSQRVDLGRRSGDDEFSLLEKTINSMAKNLEKLDKMKTDFVLLSSHQLRTPASAVKGFLSLMLSSYTKLGSAEHKELLTDAYNENERQIHLINQILAISQAENKQLVLAKKDVNLVTITRDAIKRIHPLLKQRKQKVTLHVSRHTHHVVGDAEKLSMVVENLITNAMKYSPPSTEIIVWLDNDKQSETIKVQDQGYGIAPEEVDLLFKKFSRLDNPNSVASQGSGLGLYLVKMLIRMHGGTIDVESIENQGTTFTVRLPRKD